MNILFNAQYPKGVKFENARKARNNDPKPEVG